MVIFKELTIKNFLSYGNKPTTFKLDKSGTTFILGQDMDNTSLGVSGNGCGKSAILNALVFGVFDNTISKISKSNLVNNINGKDLEVKVKFEKDDKKYRIVRTRKGKQGADVKLYCGRKDITPDSIAETNRRIVEIVGTPFELFVRIVAFSATHEPFLALPRTSQNKANQQDIIEELFELKVLTERSERLKKEIKNTDQDINVQQAIIDQSEGEHNRHNAQIDAMQTRVNKWEVDNKNEINSIKEKLNIIKDIDIDEQRRFHDRLNEVNTHLGQALQDQRQLEVAIKKNIKDTKKYRDELTHLEEAKCPYCKQEYKDTKAKIKELKETLEELKLTFFDLEKELTSVDESVKDFTEKQSEVTSKIEVNNIKELIEIRSKQEQYKAQMENLAKTENPYLESLSELKLVEIEDVNMDKMNELIKLQEHHKFLQKVLTKKDSFVRKTLLNKHIPFLNKQLSKYLLQLGLMHSVKFTHEMTVSITQFGRELDFGNLSNGQQARVNLALSFAFRDVLESMHEKFNVCILDEVLDVGLDTVGVHVAAKLLKNKARDEKLSVYIISHRDEINSAFERRMTVKLSKGFSYIEEL